jgi:hypothetical protein
MIINPKMTAIKRSDNGSNLDGLFGYTAGDVENTREVEVISMSEFDEIIEEFKENNYCSIPDSFVSDKVFTPNEINLIAMLIDPFYDKSQMGIPGGLFLTQLIKNSYEANHNEFNFNFLGLRNKISYLGYQLCGTEDRPIKINIVGNVGFNLFTSSQNIDAKFDGNILDGFLAYAINSKVYVKGNLDYNAFMNAKNVAAIIKGDLTFSSGLDSENLILAVDGNIECLDRAKEAYVSGKIETRNDDSKYILSGKSASMHPKYIELMKELEERIK